MWFNNVLATAYPDTNEPSAQSPTLLFMPHFNTILAPTSKSFQWPHPLIRC
jgi:hypothetical protein